MKPRILKKLSKRLVHERPTLFKDAFLYSFELPYDRRAKHQNRKEFDMWCMGGGENYWGEAQDVYPAYEWWGNIADRDNELSDGLTWTTRRLLKLANHQEAIERRKAACNKN